jgi:hypothetical protein
MPIPNLIHPVPIVIQRKDDAKTYVDGDFREPIQQSARLTNTTVPGQVKWFSDEEMLAGHAGIQAESEGYILFRRVDLAAAGVVLKLNDRFTKLANVDTDLYIVNFRHEGHWPTEGGSTLIKAYFKDRTPSRQNRGTL